MPSLNRIEGLKLPADVFANVLQLHQFITNFYDCLEFKLAIPTLNTFQQALLYENKSSEQAVAKVLCHMLGFALNDPGVQYPSKVCVMSSVFLLSTMAWRQQNVEVVFSSWFCIEGINLAIAINAFLKYSLYMLLFCKQ